MNKHQGTSFHKGRKKWYAYIKLADNTQKHLGVFTTEEEALNARKAAEKLYGIQPRKPSKLYTKHPYLSQEPHIYPVGNKYVVKITKKGKLNYLGTFSTLEEAQKVKELADRENK